MAVWDAGAGPMGFLAPPNWRTFLSGIDLPFVAANGNRELTCAQHRIDNKGVTQMANTLLESQVSNHLEFVGYEVNPFPEAETEEIKVLRAEHSARASMNIMFLKREVSFTVMYDLNDYAMANRQGLLEVVNELNGQSATQYYIGGKGGTVLFYMLTYRGPYDKSAFAQFVSTWESEGQALWRTEMDRFVG